MAFEGVGGQGVKVFGEAGVSGAVGQGGLAVQDFFGAGQRGKDGRLGHPEDELVTARHGAEQGAKAEVLYQVFAPGRERPVGLEVLARVHEQDFHWPTRSSTAP